MGGDEIAGVRADDQIVPDAQNLTDQCLSRRASDHIVIDRHVADAIGDLRQLLSAAPQKSVFQVWTEVVARLCRNRSGIDDAEPRARRARKVGSALECRLRGGSGVDVNQDAVE